MTIDGKPIFEAEPEVIINDGTDRFDHVRHDALPTRSATFSGFGGFDPEEIAAFDGVGIGLGGVMFAPDADLFESTLEPVLTDNELPDLFAPIGYFSLPADESAPSIEQIDAGLGEMFQSEPEFDAATISLGASVSEFSEWPGMDAGTVDGLFARYAETESAIGGQYIEYIPVERDEPLTESDKLLADVSIADVSIGSFSEQSALLPVIPPMTLLPVASVSWFL